jgi:hypothetical protein
VDELSGGQFVLVDEAVNLGIVIYNMRQGEGIRYERCSGTKRWDLWILSMARSMCACFDGRWTWEACVK